MENNINLVSLIKNNFDSIKNNTYEWKDEEVSAVYKLATAILLKYKPKYRQRNDFDDILNVMAIEFFNKVNNAIILTSFFSMF